MDNNNQQIELKDVVIQMKDGFKKSDEKIDDVLLAMNKFADNVQGKFEKIDEKFEKIDEKLTKIEATMVTKDYLDDKLSDLRGDLVVLTRKEDKKIISLVEILEKKKILSRDDAKYIFSLEPFAQIQTV